MPQIKTKKKTQFDGKDILKILRSFCRLRREELSYNLSCEISAIRLKKQLEEVSEVVETYGKPHSPLRTQAEQELKQDREDTLEMISKIRNEEERYLEQLCLVPPLTKKEERRFIERIQQGDKEAEKYFIRANQRLILKTAKWYQKSLPYYHLDILDLVGQGNLGLYKTLKEFDLSKGTKFSTVATNWIRNRIQKHLEYQGQAVRVRNEIFYKVKKMRAAEELFLQSKQRQPTYEELARKMKLPLEKIITLHQISRLPLAMDHTNSESGEESGLNIYLSSKDHNEKMYDEVREGLYEKLGAILTVREMAVIKRRFGLDQTEPMTNQQIGDLYGVSRETIRNIEKKAMVKIDEEKDKHNLKSVLGELVKLADKVYGPIY